ncbi:MAG: hypothetical protein KF763_08970 [Cyclobacteriaceae bacterium]|nr:hypothetical protein [Cyclobacteriaceae bacterium]
MRILFFALLVLVSGLVYGQRAYITSDGEIILGFANINNNGTEDSGIPRFSMFFHGQTLAHFDQTNNFGLLTGISLRNVGFITDAGTDLRTKHRTYNVGLPIGIKVGDMDGMYVYGGYELELPFNYKEKRFENDEKVSKFNTWFSRRTPAVYHTAFAGIRFPRGFSLRFKYYATPFFNKNFTVADGSKPYQNLEVNTFHIAFTSMITKGKKVVIGKRDD